MHRKALAVTSVLPLIFLLVVGVQTVKAPYTTDGRYFILASPLTITSPSNNTYTSSNMLILNVTFKLLLSPSCADVSYSVDGKNNATIPLTATREPVEVTRTYANGTTVIVNSTSFFIPFTITGWVALPELPEGPHNITVYAKYNANNIIAFDNSTVYFTISANSEQQIPEFPTWTFLPLFMVATLLTVIIYKRLLKKSLKALI